MKKIFLMLFLVCSIFVLSSCANNNKYLSGTIKAEIKVQNKGVIRLELYADEAPITVTNFVELVEAKFYDGLTFHRIVKDFMIQGGDPNADGTGGSGRTITGEFEANGIKNSISHTRGVISMGRTSNDYNSASSQFFIVQKDSTFLDGNYAAFGRVTEGIEIIDDIANNTSIEDSKTGYVAEKNQPVIEYIKIIE